MNSEQIKIISVVITTLLFAILLEPNRRSSTNFSKTNKMSSIMNGKPTALSKKKSNSKPSKQSCRKKGFNLYGKVQFVDSFPDLTIQYVNSFPDINVEFVSSFASSCGQWQEVDSFPDFKVQVVSSFADLKVKKVSSFPGMK